MPIVRIKPFDPRKGQRLRSLIDSANDGKRYVEGHLYQVSQAEADHLACFMQDATRVDTKVVVHGMARAFDVYPDMPTAQRAVEEEVRAGLVPGATTANRAFTAPGRDAAEAPVPAPASDDSWSAPAPAAASPDRPPTAQERRNASIARATAKAKKGATAS